jgi:hypothetical protein
MTTAHNSFLLPAFSLHDRKRETAKMLIADTRARIVLFIGKVEKILS